MTAAVRDCTVDVGDGELAVAEYGPPDGIPLLAIHGITASSRAWLALARHLPDVRLLAPDLRGRGRSAGLLASSGLRTHAADLEHVLRALDLDRVAVVGHSMGAFVAVTLAARRPDAVHALVLVDGGYPLPRPAGVSEDDLSAALLAPIAARLSREFADHGEYLAYWRQHPAFGGEMTSDLAAYAAYDLLGEPPRLRPTSTLDAIVADARELSGPDWYRDALGALRGDVPLLRAPRGLLDEPGGLYPDLPVHPPLAPAVRVVDVPDVNHYTILMSDPGARVVADAVRPLLLP